MHAVDGAQVGGRRLSGILPEDRPELPLVSVVTVVFNGICYLSGCIDSVLAQDYSNIELVVVDGGSTDGTLNLLRSYGDRIDFWRSEPDGGIYDAWNKGVREARGQWICFLGADDEFLPGAVTAYMGLARSHPSAEYLSSLVRWIHPSGYMQILGGPWSWLRFSRFMCTAHVGSMHRRSLFERLGSYDTSFRIVADYELLLRARGTLRTAFLPTLTVNMRAGGISDSTAALEEQTRAKVEAGGRQAFRAAAELYFAKAKFLLRPLRRVLQGAGK